MLEKIGFYTLSDHRAKNASACSRMMRCEMIITEHCNFRCPYCRGLRANIYGDRKKRQLSIEEIKRNIDFWCDGKPLENIRFSGGEPTMHPHLAEAVDHARSRGVKRIAISTNGSRDMNLYTRLIEAGVNDVSISLDACCAEDGDRMSGGIKGSFDTVVANIRSISKLTYVTVGIVLTPENVESAEGTIKFAHSLGVADIRVIPSAQWNASVGWFPELEGEILARHPILAYRIGNFRRGRHVRGLTSGDFHHCGLVLDDSVIAGDFHFPCVIYMREGGNPIGRVGPGMRAERAEWMIKHDVHEDPICRKGCLDVCIDYCNKFRAFH